MVMLSKHNQLMLLLTDAFHRVATNGSYNVDYKKSEMVSEEAPKPAKGSKSETDSAKPKAKGKGKAKAKQPAEVSEPETVVVKKEEEVA